MKPKKLYTTHQQLADDNDGIFKCWYRPFRKTAVESVPVLVIPLTPETIHAIRSKAMASTAEQAGSHLDTIERTLAAVGLMKKPSPEI